MRETGPPTPKPRGVTKRVDGKPRRSLKQKQAARETALRLVAEGKFGGRAGAKHVNPANRRTPKHVPRAAHLLQIFRTVEHERLKGERGQLSRLVDHVPEDALVVDSDRASEAICAALQAALDARTLPRKSVVALRRKQADLLWNHRRQRPLAYGEKLLDLHDPRPDDFVGYGPKELLQCCALLGDGMVHHGPESMRAADFVRTVLHGLGDRVREELVARQAS